MTPICFYHRADFDGVCSGAIVKKFVPDCELYGIDYGDLFPWDRVEKRLDAQRRTVYMVDFSLPAADMIRLHATCNLVWIDHHKSAIVEMAGLHPDVTGVRYDGMSACELCWLWFTGDQASMQSTLGLPTLKCRLVGALPKAVSLLGRYDVWDKHNLEWRDRILPFQMGLKTVDNSMKPTSPLWEVLLSDEFDPDGVISRGDAVLAYQRSQQEAIARDGAYEDKIWVPTGPATYGGTQEGKQYFALCLNTPERGSSTLESLYDPTRHDVMMVYGQLRSGRWRHSLYSTREDVDCSVIAKSFGGGGHKGAAGFIADAPVPTPEPSLATVRRII